MSSLPTNLFSTASLQQEPVKRTVWVEIKMIARSIREAWKPKNEIEPVETYMNY
jgi:hypothetical protein